MGWCWYGGEGLSSGVNIRIDMQTEGCSATLSIFIMPTEFLII